MCIAHGSPTCPRRLLRTHSEHRSASRTQKQLKEKEEGDLGERAMRSVIAAAVSLLCAKDDGENEEEKAEITRERDDNPETKFGQRLGDIRTLCCPR